jgi:hypothetical protein
MASILDTFCGVAEESTYGTAITSGFRGYEAQSDTFTREVQYIESVGFRQALQTVRSDRHDTISIGASGSIETDVLNKGHGLILKHMLGGSSGPTQQGGTAAYLQTFETSDDGPSGSYTVQLPRTDSSGSQQSFTYEGCVPTGFTISQAIDEALKLVVDFNAEFEQQTTAASSPTYPTSADPFVYTDATIEINGSAVNTFTSFELTGDLGLDVDRRFLKGSATKLQPIRSSVPTYSGSIEGEFTNAQYEQFRDGTIFQLELICQQSTAIAGSYYPKFHITMPKVKFTGSTPVASTDDLTRLSLPFTVLWDGSNAAVKVEYQSTDTSF